jgi:hypothetical protein
LPAALKKIDFIFFDAGGGHRSAANALQTVIERQQRPWRVRLVNLQEVLDSLDIFRKLTGLRLQDVYNQVLKRGWTLGSPQLLPLMHGVIRLYHRGQVRLLDRFWREDSPDLVVSLVPNFNRAMFEGLGCAAPGTPFVTILTDFADYPPHFWIERQPQYFICGTSRAVEQARSMGHPSERIFQTSGMILRPMFYDVPPIDRAEARRQLGLDPDLPTGLVLFGGEGSAVMADIARAVSCLHIGAQWIFLCGRNAALRRRIDAMRGTLRLHTEGFTQEVPRFMALSDFFVGKPGPGSISEALAMKLPVLIERNAWTLPQERYNTQWVEERQVGVVIGSLRHIEEGLRRLLDPANFARYRANAAATNNQAVFEIPDMLARLLETC